VSECVCVCVELKIEQQAADKKLLLIGLEVIPFPTTTVALGLELAYTTSPMSLLLLSSA